MYSSRHLTTSLHRDHCIHGRSIPCDKIVIGSVVYRMLEAKLGTLRAAAAEDPSKLLEFRVWMCITPTFMQGLSCDRMPQPTKDVGEFLTAFCESCFQPLCQSACTPTSTLAPPHHHLTTATATATTITTPKPPQVFDGPLDGEVVPGRRRRGKKSKHNSCGGWCPLICAIASGHVEVATSLLRDHGASVNCHTTKDFVSLGFPKSLSPIYIAAQCAVDPKAMVELCIEYGADINASSADLGLTPAHVSIIMRNTAGLKVCIEQSGFDVNQATTFNGATPLSYGAYFGDEVVCQLLLDAGATKTCMVSK